MKLIAEAGGTKVEWVIISETSEIRFSTVGYNPLQNDSNYLRQILISSFPSEVETDSIIHINYFGTGCASGTGVERVKTALSNFFTKARSIDVYSDLTAVGKAIFKNNSGIVGILGTGASIGFYSNGNIETPVKSLGYILGDEGSGAWIGKELLKKVIRKQLPESIVKLFIERYKTTAEKIIKETYSGSANARYIASFVPFIYENINSPELVSIIEDGFDKYIQENLLPVIHLYPEYNIGICGGVAYSFKDILIKSISNHNINHDITIIKTPIEELLK